MANGYRWQTGVRRCICNGGASRHPRPQHYSSACVPVFRRGCNIWRTEPPLLVARGVCTLLHHLQHELRVRARLGREWQF